MEDSNIKYEETVPAANPEYPEYGCRRTGGKRTYTVPEIMDILQIGKCAAYNLVASGQFRAVRIGGAYRISKESFDRWLDSQN